MDRKALREFTHCASHFLSIDNETYKQWVFRYTFLELEKDLGFKGDITTRAIFSNGGRAKAKVVAKEAGIFAGKEEIKYFLVDSDPKFRPNIRGKFEVKFLVNDGDSFANDDVLVEVEADVYDLLAVERVTLNLLMRMSGVATFTRKIVDMLASYDVLITPTRKMLWGLLDKRAVLIGGGGTHRINLTDAVLVKDTHLDLIGHDFNLLFERIKKSGVDGRFVEIEVDSPKEAVIVAKMFNKALGAKEIRSIGVLLMDNMTAEEIGEAMSEIKREGLYDGLLFEASGGVNEKNAVEYAATGVDIVSMGCLTNGAGSLNMSLKV